VTKHEEHVRFHLWAERRIAQMKTLSEFTIDFDEIDNLYYLVHRACESIETPVNVELPASSPDLLDCIVMAKAHMKDVHSVDIEESDPNDCPNASLHFLTKRCETCGHSNG